MIYSVNKLLALILFFTGLSPALVLGQVVQVEWGYLNEKITHHAVDNSLQKSTGNGQWDSWARGANSFEPGQEVSLIYNPGLISVNEMIIAFGDYHTSYGYHDVKFGFKVNQTQIRAVYRDENGVGGLFYNYDRTTGIGNEDLKITKRETSAGSGVWEMAWSINGNVVMTRPCPTATYYVYGLIRYPYQVILNLFTESISVPPIVSNQLGDEVQWDYINNNTSHDVVSNSLTKTGANNNWDAWARSADSFEMTQEVKLKYNAGTITNDEIIIALGEYQTAYDYDNVKFGFKINQTEIRPVYKDENDVASLYYNYDRSAGAGNEDLVITKRETFAGSGIWEVDWLINGIVVMTRPCPDATYHVYGLMLNVNSIVANLLTESTDPILVLSEELQEEVDWGYLNEKITHHAADNSLQKSTGNGQWDSWARSANLFEIDQEVSLIYNPGLISVNEMIIAFGEYQTTYGYHEVTFGFKVSQTQIRAVYRDENGVGGLFYNFDRSTGIGNEDLKMTKRETFEGSGIWEMDWLINGEVVMTRPCPSAEYYVYGLIRYPYNILLNTFTEIKLPDVGLEGDVEWSYLNEKIAHNAADNSLRKSTGNGQWDSWARGNSFEMDQEVSLTYNPGLISVNEMIVAFDDYKTTYGYHDVTFGFKVNQAQIRAVYRDESGVGGLFYNYDRSTGIGNEELEIKKRETFEGSGVWEVDWLINGEVVMTRPCPDATYYIYGLIRYPFQTILNVGYSASKALVASVYDETTGLSEVEVNAPSGELPYTYFISREPIPSLNTIWESIKDSLTIDSLSFFRGKENKRTYTFSDLETEHYYVAVFDNNGDEIMQKEVIVSAEVEWYDNENLDYDPVSKVISVSPASTEGASGTLLASLAQGENGAVEFEVLHLGNVSLGFNKIGAEQSNDAINLDFGVEITDEGILNIYNQNILVHHLPIEVGAKIRLEKQFDSFIVYKDLEEVYSGDIDIDWPSGHKFDVKFEDSSPQLIMRMVRLSTVIYPVVSENMVYCNSTKGKIILTSHLSGYTISAIVKNLLTGEEFNYSGVSPLNIPLVAGHYYVTYTLTNGTSIQGGGSDVVSIGNLVSWNSSDAVNHVFTQQNCLSSSPSSLQGQSTSINTMNNESSEWLTFKVGFTNSSLGNSGGPYTISYKYSQIRFIDPMGLAHVTVKIREIGNTANGFLEIVDANGLIYSASTNTNAIYSIQNFPNSSGSVIKVYENNVQKGADIVISSHTSLRVKANTGHYSSLCDVYSSFCYAVPDQYAELDRKLKGQYYKVPGDDLLRVEYAEEYMDSDNFLNYVIKDKTQQVVMSSATDPENIEFGDNRIIFNIGTLVNGTYYVLEVTNDKNETFYLRFKKSGKNSPLIDDYVSNDDDQ